MKRLPLVAALALGVSGISAAQADIEVYGQAHLAFSHLDDGDDYSAFNLSSNASRLGFRAGHDVGPNLRALVQLEGQVDIDNGGDQSITSRDSFAGLEGDWGLLRAGRFDTPNKTLRSRTDLFGNQVGDARNIVRGNYGGNQGVDERFRNGIAYRTPSFGGVFVDVHYSADGDSDDNAADSNDDDAWSASLTYQQGPAYAAVSHERWNEGGDRIREMTRVAASYDLADVRVTGLAQSGGRPSDDAFGVGLRYALVGDIFLKGQYYVLSADDSDQDADMIAVGADYHYSDELRFYLNYAQIDNDDAQNRQPWVEASTLGRSDGGVGETARSVAAGLVYNF
ncbi:porin [Aquisalimonas asiatica]|uniref:Outer membrane protein (Porin) n=1 Tax=Aquisalimonas asiatica TaxID=406100 RepID=A0A1H8SKF7_9GAMM|nr:porin [Aquisalimonas asiatica]SEO78844.1 Outer membrane protein (porin) [Aquisalimonas asiatica]